MKLGKIIVSFLLLAAFLINLGAGTYVMVNFKLNQKVIAEKFCENKDKPEMKCNGKCHMHKQLKKTKKKKEEKVPISPEELETTTLVYTVPQSDIPISPISNLKELMPVDNYKKNLLNGYHSDLLKPPRC